MMDAVRTLLLGGEDPEREGLLKTPKRVEAMSSHQWLQQSLEEIVNDAIFDEGHNEMVLVRISMSSASVNTTCCRLWAKLTLPISLIKKVVD